MNSSSIENSLGPIPERVDADAMKSIKAHLLNGDRTSAVWHAVDKRLWSHAMLMAGTVSKGLWKQVVQDFVKNEIKSLGNGHESLAVLYEVFGGNGEESIDELVPQSARLGQPMMTSAMGTVVAEDPQKGLENWRETLALIISNRSVGDTSAILSLGNLLGTYARVHASHLWFVLFSFFFYLVLFFFLFFSLSFLFPTFTSTKYFIAICLPKLLLPLAALMTQMPQLPFLGQTISAIHSLSGKIRMRSS